MMRYILEKDDPAAEALKFIRRLTSIEQLLEETERKYQDWVADNFYGDGNVRRGGSRRRNQGVAAQRFEDVEVVLEEKEEEVESDQEPITQEVPKSPPVYRVHPDDIQEDDKDVY
mmetsp:Transcript_2107/g.3798  ORF Transcript_2107/g.3798 Transcript_2107/m.3798 type:complete len:115 (+) Transcript_2107:821-1165(+)